MQNTETTVAAYPACDLCRPALQRDAHFDGKTDMGPWAYMCDTHFRAHGLGLGLGRGQRLILPDA